MIEYGMQLVMYRHNIITPDQKVAFKETFVPLILVMGLICNLIVSILPNIKDAVFRQANMNKSGQRIAHTNLIFLTVCCFTCILL